MKEVIPPLTASQAKQIAMDVQNKPLNLILKEIEKASRLGNTNIYYEPEVSKVTIKKLEELGFEVFPFTIVRREMFTKIKW